MWFAQGIYRLTVRQLCYNEYGILMTCVVVSNQLLSFLEHDIIDFQDTRDPYILYTIGTQT